jgi:DNA-directed RNA polymerase subunit L
MKLVLLENKEGKMVLEVRGENHTFLNLLRENAWDAGSRQASYIIEHPYLSEPKLIIRADNPKKVLDASAQAILDSAKEFEKEFSKVSAKK